ncbi:hypothetical protein GYMLUDRAFT_39090 [Collybiopsis luxurians FD-317 M1]|nr:hypothetical protein GYMLUDRAFT_39090 [Collybiopsis luxurians FD-317 M1]
MALRIIGWAQSGEQVLNRSLLEKVSPLAVLSGIGLKPKNRPKEPTTSSPPPKLSLPLSPAGRGSLTVEDLAHFKKLPQSPLPDSPHTAPSIPSIFPSASVTRQDIEAWNVPPLFVSHAHKIFDTADKSQQGYLDTNDILPLFRKARLPDDQLSAIWNLIGVERSGRTTKDNFVGVAFLVCRSLARLELPESLPESFTAAYSTKPPPADPFSSVASSSSSSSPDQEDEDEVGGLYAQIRALQDALATIGRENEDLRSSVQTLHRVSRQQSMSHNRMSRNVDSGLTEIARLQIELQEKDHVLARLRASLQGTEDLNRENAMLRVQTEELTARLEVSRDDVAAQTLVSEELSRESERLKRQIDELRESSTQVPSVNGDQELQNLINEDLSRENRRLRNQVRELQESISQLQTPNEELDSLKEATRAMTRENKRLQRRVRELESASIPQDSSRRRLEELNRENERLRRDLEQARRRSTAPQRNNSTDLPPPAYEEIAR